MSSNEHFHHAQDKTELEKVLNKGIERVEPYSNLILMLVLAITVGGVGLIVWYRGRQANQTAVWNEFFTLQSPDDFAVLANRYPDLLVGKWARLEAGRRFLREGLDQALTNRKVSDERLMEAINAFEELMKPDTPGEIREEALYGLATCREALSNGDNEPAIQAYEQLISEFPDSTHRGWAEARINALKTGDAKDFYAWFRSQNPTPADRQLPRDLSTPAAPKRDLPSFSLTPDESKGTDEEAAPPSQPAAPEMPDLTKEKPAETPVQQAPPLPSTDSASESKSPSSGAPPVPAGVSP